MPDAVSQYLRGLRRALKHGDATEHTHRPTLKAFVEALHPRVTAVNEPKRIACGAPDLAVVHRTPAGPFTIGHIETKDIGADLGAAARTEQLKRYLRSLGNLVLTDYLEFRWYVEGECRATARLATQGTDGRLVRDSQGAKAVAELLADFLARSPEPVAKPQDLAERMARLTHMVRDLIVGAFDSGLASATLKDLRSAFAKALIPDLDQPEKTGEFADMFAQTIAYGLFAACCNHDRSTGPFQRLGAAAEIPKTNPFLRTLFNTITGPELDDEPYAGFVDDLVALLAHTDIRAVLEHFGQRNRREDPIVHFYETFLAAYDPRLRQARGVYYTPEPVVSYIVRSVDHILKTRFALPQGLADTGSVRFRNAAFQAAGAAASSRRDGGHDARHDSQQDAGVTPKEPKFGQVRVRDRGRLPHWEMEGGVYFITFRLADSIPKSVLETLEQEREAAKAAIESGRSLTRADRKRVQDLFSRRVEDYLDSGAGACHLGRPEVARLVGEALEHFDGDRYRLFAWCVMPNHVHVVCQFVGEHGLDDVLHSWKSFTSKQANRILGRQGRFWAREYHDHLIRDEDEFYRTLRYVRENPERTNLDQWPWAWACEDYRDVAGQEPCNATFQAAGAAASRRRDGGQDARHGSQQDAGVTKEDNRVEAPRVFILDPACGTGTFLYAVVDHIRQQFRDKGNAGMWAGYVKNHLLPRLFGFELLMAPYAVAHLKLGMQLAAQDLPEAERDTWAYDFGGNERLGVYLTNTLEEAEQRAEDLFGPLRVITEEANEANRIKRDLPIMVILGNPPYSGHSSNRSWTTDENGKRVPTFIGELLQDYYRVDGEPLGERNPKYLQDDYVKFLRWAQWRIERTGAGVLAFITNHGYLDNPTFRGMRQSLMNTFDEIHIMDLHGNTKKKERCPDGSPDHNVFDIQQGVAIGLRIKLPQGDAAS